MTKYELLNSLRKTSFVMKGMAVMMAAYGDDPGWLKHAKELEEAADMVMSWSCQKVESCDHDE